MLHQLLLLTGRNPCRDLPTLLEASQINEESIACLHTDLHCASAEPSTSDSVSRLVLYKSLGEGVECAQLFSGSLGKSSSTEYVVH